MRFLGHGQVGVGGVQRPRLAAAPSVARSASSAASAISFAASASAPSSRRSVPSTPRSRAASTASGVPTAPYGGDVPGDVLGLKLENVAVTVPAPTAPSGAARAAK